MKKPAGNRWTFYPLFTSLTWKIHFILSDFAIIWKNINHLFSSSITEFSVYELKLLLNQDKTTGLEKEI